MLAETSGTGPVTAPVWPPIPRRDVPETGRHATPVGASWVAAGLPSASLPTTGPHGAGLPHTDPYGPGRAGTPVPPPTTPRPRRPRRRRLSAWVALVLVGISLACATTVTLLHDRYGWSGDGKMLGMTSALALVALVLLIAGLTGRRGGLTTGLGLVLAVSLGASAIARDATLSAGVGDRYWTWEDPSDSYRLGFGSAELDLSQLSEAPPSADPIRTPVRLGLGELVIRLPADRAVTIAVDARAGSVFVDGVELAKSEPVSYRATFGTGTPDRIVEVRLIAGDVRIESAPR